MEELERLGSKLPIQPLYVQFFVHLTALSIICGAVNDTLFTNTIPFGVEFLEVGFYGVAMTVSTVFTHRKSYGLLGKKRSSSPRLKYWVDFQKAILVGRPPKSVEARKDIPWLIKESNRRSKRIYGPMMLTVGGLVNALLFYVTDQTYWIFFVAVFLLFGIGLFYESKSRLKKMKRLERQL